MRGKRPPRIAQTGADTDVVEFVPFSTGPITIVILAGVTDRGIEESIYSAFFECLMIRSVWQNSTILAYK